MESSLGVQIEVPAHWAVNDYGCNMSDKPTVVRGGGVVLSCLTPEKATKEVAEIGLIPQKGSGADPAFPRRPVSLDGVSAERSEGRGADGRFFGWVSIPSQKVLVSVRTHDPAVTRRILDSVKVAAVDPNGCSAKRPAGRRPKATRPDAQSAMVPPNPTSISICYYGTDGDALQASTRLSGEKAVALAAALNGAASGPNPDADPKTCLHPPAPPPADIVLLADDTSGPTTVFFTFSGCVGRGLDNGAKRGQVKKSLIQLVMGPLQIGYAFNGDLSG